MTTPSSRFGATVFLDATEPAPAWPVKKLALDVGNWHWRHGTFCSIVMLLAAGGAGGLGGLTQLSFLARLDPLGWRPRLPSCGRCSAACIPRDAGPTALVPATPCVRPRKEPPSRRLVRWMLTRIATTGKPSGVLQATAACPPAARGALRASPSLRSRGRTGLAGLLLRAATR